MRALRIAALAIAAAIGCAGVALAQDYPTRPITIVAPFPAGSITDTVARLVAEHLGRALRQPVQVENKVGQEGAIAARSVAQAQPDGYTLLAGGSTTHSAAAALYKSLPYDPTRDLRPIGGVMKVPVLLCVRTDFPAGDLASFLEQARAKKGQLSFASGSPGTRASGELLKARAGVDLLHVPYRGIPQAMTDLVGGRVDSAFIDPANAIGMIEDGKIRALAASSASRVGRLPAVPTIAESGFAGFEVVPWIGLFVPAGTPDAIVARLSRELERFHAEPAAAAFADKVGVQLFPANVAQITAYLATDMKQWEDVVRLAGIERN